MFSQVGGLPSSHGWIIFLHACLCTHTYINVFFIHSSFGGHLGYFRVLTIVNNPVVNVWVLVAQSYLTLCDPMDCSPPGSSVHGILWQEHWSGLPCPSPVISFREWFHFLWIYIQIWDFWIMFFFFFFSIFWETPMQFSIVSAPIYIPTHGAQDSPFSTSSPHLLSLISLIISVKYGNIIISCNPLNNPRGR